MFFCPYLDSEVELTPARERHIADGHPDLLPEYRSCLSETLADPDMVRRSSCLANVRLFSRWFPAVRGGKHVVVVVGLAPDGAGRRHFIITAYIARRLAEGEVEWQRS